MAGLKSLAKETAIYGLSSIVGRFLNYLLVPVYTSALSAQSGGYGVVTNLYAWTALAMVMLTFGMETGFFRFANRAGEDPKRVYSTTLLSVGAVAVCFLLLGLLFLHPLAGMMGYADHPWYLGMMMAVVAMDAIQSIPFAYLRYQKRPLKFAALKLLFIFLNITLNLIYYVVMRGSDVSYAFLFNLICTSVVMLCLIPEMRGFAYILDRALLRRMLAYSLPLLVLGLAGILNQVADKIIFRFVYPDESAALVQLGIYGAASKIAMVMAMLTQAFRFAYEPFVFGKSREKDKALVQLGIYGAASKIAMVMAMLTQAFRFAYEPFVFGKSREKDNRAMYAQAMKFFIIFTLLAFLAVMFYLDVLKFIIGRDYWPGLRVVPIVMAAEIQAMKFFIIFTLLAFLAVMFYLDVLKFIIGRDYWPGLRVVPIVMAAEIFMGVYFNLSFWYKLIDETRWGAYFSLTGCTILILLNIFLIPRYGYMACAWAGFAGYGVAMVLSYVVGQKKYPIQYDLKAIGAYVLLAAVLYVAAVWVPVDNLFLRLAYRTLLLLIFLAYVVKRDLPLRQIPVINRLIK